MIPPTPRVERVAVLAVFTLAEILVGLGLHNEGLAARGRIEAHRRRAERCTQRIAECRGFLHELKAADTLAWRARRHVPRPGELPEL